MEAVVAEVPATEEPAVEETPVGESPVEEAPVEEAPAEEARIEEARIEEAPVEAPSEEVPAEEAPVEEAPAEEAPVEEAPVQEAPVEEAPAEEAPLEKIPIEEAPVEEAPQVETEHKEEIAESVAAAVAAGAAVIGVNGIHHAFEREKAVEEPAEVKAVPAEHATVAKDEPIQELKEKVITPESAENTEAVAVVLDAAPASSSEAKPAVAEIVENGITPSSKAVELETKVTPDSANLAPVAEITVNGTKQQEPYMAAEPPTPEPEADPALKALLQEREALLRKLDQPSTDQLSRLSVAGESIKPSEEPADAAPSTETAPAAQQQSTGQNLGAPSADNAKSRSPSADRSVAAVSFTKSDSWLKAILRSIVFNFFGTIFAPFRRRRGNASQ